jgi:hypothetical protein
LNIGVTEAASLADILTIQSLNSRLLVLRERELVILHYRPKIVSANIVTIGNMLVEVMFLPCLDILEKNPYESVSVLATLLMPETDGMTNLVDRAALVAPRGPA